MARRRLLTREALTCQLDPPTDEREIARHFTLMREDFDWISIRRGPASQLGYAMILLYMRWPGRILGADEIPPLSVLSFVARQFDMPEAAWCDYGRRAPTRRAHLIDLARRMGYRAFGRTDSTYWPTSSCLWRRPSFSQRSWPESSSTKCDGVACCCRPSPSLRRSYDERVGRPTNLSMTY